MISNASIISFEERLLTAEFDDALCDQAPWKNPRYDGSKMTGRKINAYYAPDVRINNTLTSTGITPEQVTIGGGFNLGNLPPFDHPDPIIANISDVNELTLNTSPQQITSQRSIGIEVTREGAAPAFVTVTIEANNQV